MSDLMPIDKDTTAIDLHGDMMNAVWDRLRAAARV